MTIAMIEPNEKKIIVVGGGGHGKVCIEILKMRNDYKIVGVVDSLQPVGSEILGVKVVGDHSILKDLKDAGVDYAINGVGSALDIAVRRDLYNSIRAIGFKMPNLIHPSACIDESVILGDGNQIMMGSCIGAGVILENNCIVNTGAIISHDSVLKNHAHIAPGAILGGGVIIGELCLVGMGVTIFMGIKLGDRSIVSNGANIFRDVACDEIIKV